MTSLFDFSDIAFLATFWAIIPSVALAALVHFRGHSTWREKIFVFSSFVFVLWASANYLSLQPDIDPLFWARGVLALAILLQFIFLLSVYSVSGRLTRISATLLFGLGALSAFVMLAALTKYIFADVIIEQGAAVPIAGPLMPLFAITIFVLFGLGGIHLIREIRTAKQGGRSLLLSVAIGYFAMFVSLIITQFVLVTVFQNTIALPFGPLLTIPFLLSTSYSILKHNLFNIRVIATEIFTAIVILIFTVNVFLSSSMGGFIANSILLALVVIFGVLLIRGTYKEIRALEELSDAKSEFISIASHQLRTPLTAIKGYISMILEGIYGEEGSRQKEALRRVYISNERLVRLVNDLLNVSRIEQGRLVYAYARVSISAMISSIVEEFRVSSNLKGLELRWQEPRNVHAFIAWADEGKLRQAVLNLVDNAIKYTEEGFVEITLKEDINPALMRISVRDSGVGLSSEDKQKIFKRFSRGKDSFKINTGGTGLGLFVAKKMVEDHRGHIWAESAGPQRGSTFIITIPYYGKNSHRGDNPS